MNLIDPVVGNENAVINNCDVCGWIYNSIHELEVHEHATLELDKDEFMKSDRKGLSCRCTPATRGLEQEDD